MEAEATQIESTEQAAEPAGSPWTGATEEPVSNDNGAEESWQPEDETPNEYGAIEAPDLSEQEQALLQKLGAAGDEQDFEPEIPDGYQAVYPTEDGTWVDAEGNLVDPATVTELGEDGNGYSEQADYQPDYADQDPRVGALGVIVNYLQGKQIEERDTALHAIAEENPDLLEDEMLEAVEGRAQELAAEAGNPRAGPQPDLRADGLAGDSRRTGYGARGSREGGSEPWRIPRDRRRGCDRLLTLATGRVVGPNQGRRRLGVPALGP
jgi:hypothetical protein